MLCIAVVPLQARNLIYQAELRVKGVLKLGGLTGRWWRSSEMIHKYVLGIAHCKTRTCTGCRKEMVRVRECLLGTPLGALGCAWKNARLHQAHRCGQRTWCGVCAYRQFEAESEPEGVKERFLQWQTKELQNIRELHSNAVPLPTNPAAKLPPRPQTAKLATETSSPKPQSPPGSPSKRPWGSGVYPEDDGRSKGLLPMTMTLRRAP